MITELYFPTVAKDILQHFLATAPRIKEGVGVPGKTNYLPLLSCLDFCRKKKSFSYLLLFCWREESSSPACIPRTNTKGLQRSWRQRVWHPGCIMLPKTTLPPTRQKKEGGCLYEQLCEQAELLFNWKK